MKISPLSLFTGVCMGFSSKARLHFLPEHIFYNIFSPLKSLYPAALCNIH